MEVTAETLRKRAEQLTAQAQVYHERMLMARGAAAALNDLAAHAEKAQTTEKTDA